jgi:hypothetical protein
MKELIATLALSLAVLSVASPGETQQRQVQMDGRVQWIAGQTLMLILDGGRTVNVDLSGVPLDDYTKLRERDRVVVHGVLADDNRQVIATAVTPQPPQPAPSVTP